MSFLDALLRPRDQVMLASTGNENYAIGLCAAVRSALDGLPADSACEVTILDGGLRDETKQMLLASWKRPRTRVRFVRPDDRDIAHLKLTQGMQTAIYYRLLLPEILPRAERVIYLDADIVVHGDLTELWETDLRGNPVAAARDALSPSLDAIPNHRAIGLDPDAHYCNTGVMVMDLDAWRRHNLAHDVIHAVAWHPDSIRWWDQDGLNIALNGGWTALDPRWNVTAEAAMLLGWTPPDADAHRSLVEDQKVVHFATRYKPWKHDCPHPRTDEFFRVLERTSWKGWKPRPETAIPWPPEAL